MSDINIGDEVVCIYSGDGTGPDCKVGNKFIVLGIDHNRYGKNDSCDRLIFNCHPYRDGIISHPSARIWRFAKVKDIEIFTNEHTVVKDKINV